MVADSQSKGDPMNSKQRVHAAIAREAVDKVPLGFYVADCDTVEKVIGRTTFVRNKPATKLALWEGRRDEVAEGLKQDTVEFYQKLDCVDLICFKEASMLPPKDYDPDPPKKIDEETYEDTAGRIWKLNWESNDVAVVYDPTPLVEEYTPEMFPEQDPDTFAEIDESCFEVCDYLVEKLGRERYIASNTTLNCMPLPGGMEHGLMQWGLAPDAIEACARQSCARARFYDAVRIREGTDGALIEEDMAGTNGLMVSPTQWREISLPIMRERVASIKKHTEQVVLHCCGRTVDIMDDLIGAGIDCYQSLQTFAGMGPDILCPTFGARMAFWGGVPTEVLVSGTPEEMRGAVRITMEKTSDFPGFILGPSHSIAFGTRYENLMAMLDEFDRLR